MESRYSPAGVWVDPKMESNGVQQNSRDCPWSPIDSIWSPIWLLKDLGVIPPGLHINSRKTPWTPYGLQVDSRWTPYGVHVELWVSVKYSVRALLTIQITTAYFYHITVRTANAEDKPAGGAQSAAGKFEWLQSGWGIKIYSYIYSTTVTLWRWFRLNLRYIRRNGSRKVVVEKTPAILPVCEPF